MSSQPSAVTAVVAPPSANYGGGEGDGTIITTGRSGGATADLVLRVVTGAAALVIMLMLAALVAVLTMAALPSIKAYGWSFVTSTEWRPNELEQPRREGGKIVRDEFDEPIVDVLPPVFG